MLCRSLRVYEWLDRKRLGIRFFFLSKNDINSVLKIPLANFCRLTTPQIHPGRGKCVASRNFNCVQFVDATFIFIKVQSASETVFYKLKAFNFSVKLLCVLSKQLVQPQD